MTGRDVGEKKQSVNRNLVCAREKQKEATLNVQNSVDLTSMGVQGQLEVRVRSLKSHFAFPLCLYI